MACNIKEGIRMKIFVDEYKLYTCNSIGYCSNTIRGVTYIYISWNPTICPPFTPHPHPRSV
jgi:hypothetical protein